MKRFQDGERKKFTLVVLTVWLNRQTLNIISIVMTVLVSQSTSQGDLVLSNDDCLRKVTF